MPILLPLLAATLIQAERSVPGTDPLTAPIVTEDIARFWRVFDDPDRTTLVKRLKRDYIDVGTPGLKAFVRLKIGSADRLALAILADPARYELVRARTLRIAEAVPRIRAAFCALENLYPDARFPTVTFVIGRFNSGGTVTADTVLLGAEMDSNAVETTHAVVAHELIHANQRMLPLGLRKKTLIEGGADFLGEFASGVHINDRAHAYGTANEAALWTEWKRDVADGNRVRDWIGTYSQTDPRPGDLSYYIGYRVARSYYDRAGASGDAKRRAVREILTRTDAEAFVRDSGYNPK